MFLAYLSCSLTEELLALAQSNPSLHLLQMDVTDQAVYDKVVQTVTEVIGEEGLNLLINNAGVLPQNRDLQVRGGVGRVISNYNARQSLLKT